MSPTLPASSVVSRLLSFRSKPFTGPLLCSTAALVVLAALSGCSKSDTKPPAPRVQEVGVIVLKAERAVFNTELPGRTVSPITADVRPQVGGILKRRLFQEGSFVKAGQVLYEIDPAPFEAAAASASASVRKAEAAVATAKTTAARNNELVKIDAISAQVNETSQAAALQAEADLAVSRAAEQTARINLGYTKILAPISGWIELSTVTPGALLTANQTTAMSTIRQLDPLYVDVSQTTSELLRLKTEFAKGHMQRTAAGEAPVKIVLEDGSTYPFEGKLTFSGVTVDTGTGAVTLRAIVPNKQGSLMPGMYVKAVLQEGTDDSTILIPQQAVTRTPDGNATTLLIDQDNKVVKRPITVGRAVGARWQVLSGVKAGDRILVEGSQRVRVNDIVKPVDPGLRGPRGGASAPGGRASGASGSAGGASAPGAPSAPASTASN